MACARLCQAVTIGVCEDRGIPVRTPKDAAALHQQRWLPACPVRSMWSAAAAAAAASAAYPQFAIRISHSLAAKRNGRRRLGSGISFSGVVRFVAPTKNAAWLQAAPRSKLDYPPSSFVVCFPILSIAVATMATECQRIANRTLFGPPHNVGPC